MRMRCRSLATLILSITFPLLAASCRKTEAEPSLRDRILAANPSQYCLPNACFNPLVLAVEDGYYVTTFAGAKPQYLHVSPKDLSKYLQRLPMQAWPQGPKISISPSDFEIDGKAVARNLETAQQICQSLGLDVQVRPGG